MIFEDWFSLQPLSAGDWPFLFEETIKEFSFLPVLQSGNYFALDFFYQSTTKILNSLSFSWPLIERLVWFWPFLILTIFSSWFLAKTLFPKEKIIQSFAPVVYLFNTYILMIVGGGQMGIGLAYAVGPLVLGLFIRLINDLSVGEVGLTSLKAIGQRGRIDELKGLVLAGLMLAIQVMFDPRIALVTMGAAGLYTVFRENRAKVLCSTFFYLIIPITLAILLHAFWLLPTLLVKQAVFLPGYESTGGVDFLSFADFSNTISLLHPNWPENVFGKVYFMRSEFVLLPLIAFSSLLFLKSKKINTDLKLISTDRNVLFFASLALVGAFLAKGSKPPFGSIYLWLFDRLPGMSMFRDPTKFYLLIAMGYSVLIPYSLSEVHEFLRRGNTQNPTR